MPPPPIYGVVLGQRAFALLGVVFTRNSLDEIDSRLRTLPPGAMPTLARELDVPLNELLEVVDVSARTLRRRKVLEPPEADRLYRVALIAAFAQFTFPAFGAKWLGLRSQSLPPTPLARLITLPGALRVIGEIMHAARDAGIVLVPQTIEHLLGPYAIVEPREPVEA